MAQGPSCRHRCVVEWAGSVPGADGGGLEVLSCGRPPQDQFPVGPVWDLLSLDGLSRFIVWTLDSKFLVPASVDYVHLSVDWQDQEG